MRYEVSLTAPQIELSDGEIATFWFEDLVIEANNKKEARKEANAIRLDLFRKGYETITNDDGEDLTNEQLIEAEKIAISENLRPEIDYIEKIDEEEG